MQQAPQDPPQKKQRLGAEDVNLSAPIYEPPKQYPLAGLYNPSMVQITVEKHECETFTLPRELICARSSYFQGAFHGGFAEEERKSSVLEDVSPPVFRVFVGWLYFQSVYYDGERIEGQQQTSETSAFEDDEEQYTINADYRSTSEYHTASTNMIGLNEKERLDECDSKDPVTWPYMWLFELYIFADKYFVRDFRMKIFEIIQTKAMQKHPRDYPLPDKSEVRFATEDRLPDTSPLYRFLVDCYTFWLGLTCKGKNKRDQGKACESLPAEFLAECFIATKRSFYAANCVTCKHQWPHQTCDSVDHSREDALNPADKDPCSWHEHGDDDQERARCTLRWESTAYKFK